MHQYVYVIVYSLHCTRGIVQAVQLEGIYMYIFQDSTARTINLVYCTAGFSVSAAYIVIIIIITAMCVYVIERMKLYMLIFRFVRTVYKRPIT